MRKMIAKRALLVNICVLIWLVDASVLPSKLWSKACWRFVGAVGLEQAVERVEMFV